MNDGGSGAGRSVHIVPGCPDKLDQGLGALRDAVIRPHRVVEVTQYPRITAAALLSRSIMDLLGLLSPIATFKVWILRL